MARRRMIDTGIWTNRKFIRLNNEQRLLFLGLITIADDEGRLWKDELSIKAKVFPVDRIPIEEIQKDLDCISELGLIEMSKEVIQLVGWNEYQHIRKDRFTPSTIPLLSTNCQPSGDTGKESIVKESIVKERGGKEGNPTPPNLSFLDELKEKHPTLDVEKSYRKFKQHRKDKGLDLDKEAFVIWLESDLEKGWNLKPKQKDGKIKVRCIKGCTQKEVPSGKIRNDFCPECGEQLLEEWELEHENARKETEQ